MKQTALILILLLLAIPLITVSTLSPLSIRYRSEYRIAGETFPHRGEITVPGYTIEASAIWSYEKGVNTTLEPDPTEWSYRVVVQAGYWETRTKLGTSREVWRWRDQGTSFNLKRGTPGADGTIEHKATIDLRDAWRDEFEPNTFKLTFYRTWGEHEEKRIDIAYLIVGDIPDEPTPDDLEDTDEEAGPGPGSWSFSDLENVYDPAWGLKLPVIAVVGIIATVIVLVYRKR